MRRLITAALILTMLSCNYITEYDKPHLELSENSPYTLKITKFSWGYGVAAINEFHGDFEKLDKKVFDLLKGKSGLCEVKLQDTGKDKYGNPNDSMQSIGTIDIDELNKFQDWKYWHKESGIQALLYKKYVKRDDLPVADTVAEFPNMDASALRENSLQNQSNVHIFSITQLYATGEMPPTDEVNRYIITGIIGETDFTGGSFQVITEGGDIVALTFDPEYMEPAAHDEFATVLLKGNKVKCVGTNVATGMYALLAAKITE